MLLAPRGWADCWRNSSLVLARPVAWNCSRLDVTMTTSGVLDKLVARYGKEDTITFVRDSIHGS